MLKNTDTAKGTSEMMTIDIEINLDILDFWWDDPTPAFDDIVTRVREASERRWPDADITVHQSYTYGWVRPDTAYVDDEEIDITDEIDELVTEVCMSFEDRK